MMFTMVFSTNVSEFCYSDTGPSALPYRLTKSCCTFRDSMERTKNCIEETDVFIFSKHHNQLELELLNLLDEEDLARGIGALAELLKELMLAVDAVGPHLQDPTLVNGVAAERHPHPLEVTALQLVDVALGAVL